MGARPGSDFAPPKMASLSQVMVMQAWFNEDTYVDLAIKSLSCDNNEHLTSFTHPNVQSRVRSMYLFIDLFIFSQLKRRLQKSYTSTLRIWTSSLVKALAAG